MLLPFVLAALAAVAATPGSIVSPVSRAQAAAPAEARQLALGTPEAIIGVDTGKLKGEPVMLAWAPDDSQLYIQAVERDREKRVKSMTHFVVSIANRSMKSVEQPPAWAATYWAWKSAQNSPASPLFRINVETRQETKRATSAPTGGALARGGLDTGGAGATTSTDVASAADQTQVSTIYTLKLKTETIGEWINEPVTPGVNFGWAPAPRHVLAFAKRDGGPIVLLDEQGNKQELAGPKSAVLPAWSQSGQKMAWLERKDRKRFDVTIAPVVAR